MSSEDIFSTAPIYKGPTAKQFEDAFAIRREKEAFSVETKKRLINSELWKSCLNCANFLDKQEICLLNKLRPPAFVIVFSCEMHDYDIPF